MLEEIDRTGSISAAGRAMSMSYKKAWRLVDDLNHGFVGPLVEQVARDAGTQTADMLRGRLGLDGPMLSVRKTAQRLRLTRARIYQLLEDAATVVEVPPRFPR